MRLVDDQRVVARQPAVRGDLGQQDAVGHELDAAVLAHLVGEAHLVADHRAQLGLQLFGHARGHCPRGDAARLGAADHAGFATAGGQAQLRQLRGLAGAGFAGNHHHLMLADQRGDAFSLTRDRQRLVHAHGDGLAGPLPALRARTLQHLLQRLLGIGIARLALPARPQAQQAATVAAHGTVNRLAGVAQAHGRLFFDSTHQSFNVKT